METKSPKHPTRIGSTDISPLYTIRTLMGPAERHGTRTYQYCAECGARVHNPKKSGVYKVVGNRQTGARRSVKLPLCKGCA